MKQLTELSSFDQRNETNEQQRDTKITPSALSKREYLNTYILVNETSYRSDKFRNI